MSPHSIHCENVTVTYNRHLALHQISGFFASGSLTAVVGPNGAGKSTLLKALMGELPLVEGSLDRGGLAIRDFGYLPQAAGLDRQFPLTVADTVVLGAWRETGAFKSMPPASTRKARQALAAVGLAGFERRHIASLSSGEFQRVLFARLMMQDAPVILLDEPFTAIDARTTDDLLRIIRRWHEDGRTVIAVLHDLDRIKMHFPQTLLLARQCVYWGLTETALSSVNLLHACAMGNNWGEHMVPRSGERGTA